jgi:hypothetical protein
MVKKKSDFLTFLDQSSLYPPVPTKKKQAGAPVCPSLRYLILSFGHSVNFWYFLYAGVQNINHVYAIVNKFENVLVNKHIFDLVDIGVYVVYALYSSMEKTTKNALLPDFA